MRPRLNSRHRLLTMICAGLTAVVALIYWQKWFLTRAERASRDWLLTNTAARQSPFNPRIVFLAIDENTRTLDTLFSDDLEKSEALRLMKKGFPWNREVWAMIIDRLANAGAKSIILDLVFTPPREGDELFRAALLRHADKVVFGTNIVDDPDERGHVRRKEIGPTPELLPPEGVPSWLGFVNVFPDEDNLVRHVYYRMPFKEVDGVSVGKELYSLTGRALEKAGLGNRIPPGTKPVLFRYSENYQVYSLHEIFVDAHWNSPRYERGNFFQDKFVIIGSNEQAAEDRVQTPLGVATGPQVHVSALNAALNRDFLIETSPIADYAIIFGGGLLAWMLGALVRRPVLRLFILVLIAGAFYQVAQALANHLGIVPPIVHPLLALLVCGTTWAAFEQVVDRLERQRTRRTLERYVGQDVAHEVLDNPTSYLNAIGGQRKEITILFSDVRGFTTLTETADPHALVKQLNEYFEAMVAIVYANRGTLDKFIGDAVMAHWGSIVTAGAEVDAQRAITTVLQMRQALARLNTGWKTRGIQEMRVGFGVNHGEAIVGNLGCESKMEVSVIGDAVNLGSRLEGVTKKYHLDICIGEKVADLVRNQFLLRSVDLIIVQGKTRPVEIFTVLGKRGGTEPSWLPIHEDAMRMYRIGDFESAAVRWREVLAQNPGDGLAEVFIARCEELQKDPLEAGWSGVYEMKSK